MRKSIISWLVYALGAFCAGAVPLQVSALHPLMADLARQVGGERVQVIDLVGEGGNPHRFEPRPEDMKRMQASALVLACGKGLEPYLGRLGSSLDGVTIVEVGSTIPSLKVGKDAACADCQSHEDHDAHGEPGAGLMDPHWWHGVENMRRAARVVAQAFAEKDPAGKEYFTARALAYGRHLAELKRWVQNELGRIPPGQRKLVTAHNAFGYFAKEFSLEVIAVSGLNMEQNTTPREQAKIIEAVKKSGVRAVFPENGTSTKALLALSTTTGTRLGAPLIADGNGTGSKAGFEAMIRNNVDSITQALAAP